MQPADDLQFPASRSPIVYSKLLLVEGRDAFQFFKALLGHLNLLSKIEIRNFGGVSDWATYLDTLKIISGYHSVTSIGIVRDAELNAPLAFGAICHGLKQGGIGVPRQPKTLNRGKPRIAVFILPDCVNPGMLETLCLRAISSDPALL